MSLSQMHQVITEKKKKKSLKSVPKILVRDFESSKWEKYI